MSYAPDTILLARRLIQGVVPSLSNVKLGIVGDDEHAKSGTGYHLGKDALKATAYSIVESARDRSGLTNAASALDVGWFTLRGKNLRDFSKWLVAECAAGAPDTLDIREVIYSPDGKTVKRWDRLKIRSTGDDSHLTHTHISWFRDSELRDKTSIFRRWFVEIGALEDDNVLNADDKKWLTTEITRIVDARADTIAEEVLVKTRFLKTADNPADPKSYQRNLGDLAGDTWAAVMRGKTLGGDALPTAGVFGQINAKLDAVAAKLDALSGDADPVLTREEILAAIAAEFRTIVRDGVA